MKEQNDGFSLVELIVSMAILMIAGAALIGFLSYCMGQYKRTNEEVDLQYASQVFDNRSKNHLMQAQSVCLTDDGQILYLQVDDGLEKFYVDPAKRQVVYQKYVLSQDTWQAEGDAVCFIEFGAGVHHNGKEPYPNRPKEVAKIGEYGKGRGKRDTWVYIDEDGKHFTHGNPAAMPMWFATKEMEMSVERIVREVFR